jgi:hypothetical protein
VPELASLEVPEACATRRLGLNLVDLLSSDEAVIGGEPPLDLPSLGVHVLWPPRS